MPYVISGMVMVAGFAWTVHLLVSPDPWASDAAMAIAIGTFVLSIAAMTGLLLGRGRWTRYFAISLIIAELLITLVADFDGWLIAALAASGLALAGLSGPWMKGWLRERPAAGSPGVRPILLTVGAFSLVPLVGVVAPSGLEPAHGLLGATGILLSWGYMKGGAWALYGLRFGLPVLVLAAAVASAPLGGVAVAAVGAGLTYLAWTKSARLAVDPLPGLPAPRRKPQ